jgi:hypothetical protein
MHIDTNGPMGARIYRNIWNISFLNRRAVFIFISVSSNNSEEETKQSARPGRRENS